ncbi:MAG: hypothetical protein ACTS3T_19325 [Almyronema sp.]
MIKASVIWPLLFWGLSTFGLSGAAAGFAAAEAEVEWRGILDIFRNDRNDASNPPGPGSPGGPRPAGSCLVSPTAEATVWNLQPLFLWSNDAQMVGLQPAEATAVIWQQTAEIAEPGLLQAAYDGAALEPGATYHWLFYFSEGDQTPMFWQSFDVLGGEERDRISTDLETLTTVLKLQAVETEAIALERTRYFLSEQLYADALQEMFSVEDPSASLQQTRETLVAELCQSAPTAVTQ